MIKPTDVKKQTIVTAIWKRCNDKCKPYNDEYETKTKPFHDEYRIKIKPYKDELDTKCQPHHIEYETKLAAIMDECQTKTKAILQEYGMKTKKYVEEFHVKDELYSDEVMAKCQVHIDECNAQCRPFEIKRDVELSVVENTKVAKEDLSDGMKEAAKKDLYEKWAQWLDADIDQLQAVWEVKGDCNNDDEPFVFGEFNVDDVRACARTCLELIKRVTLHTSTEPCSDLTSKQMLCLVNALTDGIVFPQYSEATQMYVYREFYGAMNELGTWLDACQKITN